MIKRTGFIAPKQSRSVAAIRWRRAAASRPRKGRNVETLREKTFRGVAAGARARRKFFSELRAAKRRRALRAPGALPSRARAAPHRAARDARIALRANAFARCRTPPAM